MSRQEVLAICKGIFAEEPSISRVDAELRPGEHESLEMDLAFMVEGDLFDSERRVLPLVIKLMRTIPDVPVEFVILPTQNRPSSRGDVIYP